MPPADKAHFSDIWMRLKDLAAWLANSAETEVPLRSAVSPYSQNGTSQLDIWSCVYPQSAPHKSYALQVAIIISAQGAEICLCLGAGQSQMQDTDKTAQAEAALAHLKEALQTTPADVRQSDPQGARPWVAITPAMAR